MVDKDVAEHVDVGEWDLMKEYDIVCDGVPESVVVDDGDSDGVTVLVSVGDVVLI